jgi:hypothetical protein
MNRRFAFLLSCAVLTGCATTSRTVYEQPGEPGLPATTSDRYEAVQGREPAVINPLRAAAAPAQAEVTAGKSLSVDQDQLSPQAYVHVGTSHHAHDDAQAHEWISGQAHAVGADKVRLYAQADAMPGDALTAGYFVRVRLVFGASFRDLNAQERQQFGTGVRLGEIVGESPASRANLRPGDVIAALDGRPVADRAAFQAMLKEKMGRTVTLAVTRNGETIERKVPLGRTFAATQ